MVNGMGGRRDDSAPGVTPGIEPPSAGRRIGLGIGLLLAAGATAAAFVTEDPLYLRVALLAVCWAFVIAALLAGNRRADRVAAAAREAELRHAYELELEREVAARHAHEAELEGRLRREAEDALRGELAGLSQLRGELTGLAQLRTELTGLGELRNDLGRIRSELTEQLSGELLIERMVMRAQSVRGPASPAADWDVDRWAETRVVPAEPAPRPITAPPPVPPPATTASPRTDGTSLPPSPLEWLGERSLLDEHGRPTAEIPVAAPADPEPAHDRARYDDLLFGTGPYPEPSPSDETPSWSASTSYDSSGYATATTAPRTSPPVDEPVAGSGREPSGHARLEQILADSGVPAPSGGRSRRRRYRDEDGEDSGDDVLARVLGRT